MPKRKRRRGACSELDKLAERLDASGHDLFAGHKAGTRRLEPMDVWQAYYSAAVHVRRVAASCRRPKKG